MSSTKGLEDKFFQLLQFAVGKKAIPDLELSENEWAVMYDMACKQSLVGVIFESLDELSQRGQKPPLPLLYDWIGLSEKIKQQNRLVDKQCAELSDWFKKLGYKSCVIKGQGVARLYPIPESRQPGDIDIWVDGKRDDIVRRMRQAGIEVTYVDYVNCHAAFFNDTEVEVHFRPTWMFSPFTNRKVQRWIRESKDVQMSHFDEKMAFGYPTIAFNLIFSLIHIYRHVFFEGIGLRQLMDYYYILTHSSSEERNKAIATLQDFGLSKFTAALMFIMQRVFAIDKSLLLCQPNETEGLFLLGEIMRGGNFGKYDDRNQYVPDTHRWKRGLNNAKRNIRFFKNYPNEVLWMPLWKTWHWGWRKWNGYL